MASVADRQPVLALSIRQPYAELILRGIKTIEFRSRPTRRIGERFYIYAAKAKAPSTSSGPVWSADLAVPGTNTGGPAVPLWMIELARQVKLIPPDLELPTGVIVGSAVIEKVTVATAVPAVGDTPVTGKAKTPGTGNADTPGTGVATVYRWHLVD